MSVMKHEIKPYSKLEAIIVGLVLASILIPLRFLTVFVLDDSWVGSLGVISAVTLIIIILAHKEKLGRFGGMFMRQITKLHRGKKRWFFYTQTAVFFLFATTALYAIHEGNTTYSTMKDQVWSEMEAIGVDDYDAVMEQYQETPVDQQIEAVSKVPGLLFKQFGVIAVTAAITNDLMGGWYSHMLMFIAVESAEVGILLGITKKYAKAEKI